MRIWKKPYGWIKPKENLIFDDRKNEEIIAEEPLSANLELNLALIRKLLGSPQDLVIREFSLSNDHRAAIVLIDGLADRELINERVLEALMLDKDIEKLPGSNELLALIKKKCLPNISVREDKTMNEIINNIIAGNTILLLGGAEAALIVASEGWKERAVSEPLTEGVVRGPRDGFTETLRTNTSLIRRRIKSPDLRIEPFKLGKQTQTNILIMYLAGIAKEDVINEVKARLGQIKIDGVLEGGYIEEYIEDHPYSPFPQIEHSERPDKVAAAILEGRVAILVDTTPFVLVVPTVFMQFLQSAEDYYERYFVSSLVRILRLIALFVSVTLPSVYIAMTSFHQEMIPTPLALSIAASREGVPFPAVGEALLMGVFFEILREAGVRLPRPTGQAVSIVGALVIGQAAVEAGIVSQAMVIVVALTGISSFALPAYNVAIAGQLIRIGLVLLAGVLGLPGILAGLSFVFIHLCSIRVFGVSYLSPVTYSLAKGYKDVFVRSPWWSLSRRSDTTAEQNEKRAKSVSKPAPKR